MSTLSKSIKQGKDLYMKRTGKSRKDADYFIRIALRSDLPSLRDKKCGKFILGVTRMFLDGELSDEQTINTLNRTLRLITGGHLNEYDRNLNGESVDTLINRFSTVIKSIDDRDREEINKKKYVENKRYQIIPINSFEEANQYAEYTSWCIAHEYGMFHDYAGLNQFYFCLRDDYQTTRMEKGENSPLDDYGLSMVAVSVDENGNLHTCTCRWNHDNGGNDSIMDTKQISELVGRNFYETFNPNNKWQTLVDRCLQEVKDGEKPEDVFDECIKLDDGSYCLELCFRRNVLDSEYKWVFDKWFNWCYPTINGLFQVRVGNKYNFINRQGEYRFEQWFDDASAFFEDYASIELNGKHNFIDIDGKYLFDQWFDYCKVFTYGYAGIKMNEKWILINKKGEILSEQWFDYVDRFSEGFCLVKLSDVYNYISTSGKLLSKQWFDIIEPFSKGVGEVKLNKKSNFINKKGEFVFNPWFDFIYYSEKENSYIGELDGKKYKINKKGKCTLLETDGNKK